MKRAMRMAEVGLAMLALAMLTDGCATPALWSKKSYRPADKPHLSLALAPQTQDVLVQYDERCEKSKKLQTRAYWLFAYNTNATKSPKPEFANPAAFAGLEPIPLLDEAAATNTPTGCRFYAVPTHDQCGFELWRDGQDVGCFRLPVYRAAPLTLGWRVMLTPAAVAADAAITGACIGVMGMSAGPL